MNCSTLNTVNLNEGLKIIQNRAFTGTNDLKRVIIPSSVTTIGNSTSQGYSAFQYVTIYIMYPTTPPSVGRFDTAPTDIYVPNEGIITYRGASVWSSHRGKIHGFVSGPIEIMKDGQYQYKLQSCFSSATDFSLTIQGNEYLELEFSDGIGIITATGITSEMEDTFVRMDYEFNYKGTQYSGSFDIGLKYRETIDFEDAEVKRICVANWGGEYCASTNKYGVPGELTYEQAAVVTSIDSKFRGNTLITSFNEFQYFTNVTSSTISDVRFSGCTNLTKITIPNMKDHTLARWFFSNDKKLETVKVCEGNTRINGWFVNGCTNLEYLLLPSTLNNLAVASSNTYQHFLDTPAKCAYILKSIIPPSAGVSNIFQRANGKFYVPDESVELYKATAYWNSVAARIFPISQLPKDKPGCPWLEELTDEGVIQDYIDFEDPEVKRICCLNWGDYTEVTVTETVTDEAETVSISSVYTYVHKVNTSATRTTIKTVTSSRAKTEEDVVGETTTITNHPIGMTKEQAAAVTSVTGFFSENQNIEFFMEFQYFTTLRNLDGLTNSAIIFYNCQNLKRVKLPEGVTTAQNIFRNCASLTFVELPSTITRGLNNYTFGGNPSTPANKKLVVHFNTPISLTANGAYGAYCGTFNRGIYVPDGYEDAFKTAYVWKDNNIYPLSEWDGTM